MQCKYIKTVNIYKLLAIIIEPLLQKNKKKSKSLYTAKIFNFLKKD